MSKKGDLKKPGQRKRCTERLKNSFERPVAHAKLFNQIYIWTNIKIFR